MFVNDKSFIRALMHKYRYITTSIALKTSKMTGTHCEETALPDPYSWDSGSKVKSRIDREVKRSFIRSLHQNTVL